MSGNDSNAIARKEYKVGLSDGKIVIDGVADFSIDVCNPKLNVGRLYAALFANISEPTLIVLEPTSGLRQDQKAASFFESLRKIVNDACEKMNPGLAEVVAKAKRFDADEGNGLQ